MSLLNCTPQLLTWYDVSGEMVVDFSIPEGCSFHDELMDARLGKPSYLKCHISDPDPNEEF